MLEYWSGRKKKAPTSYRAALEPLKHSITPLLPGPDLSFEPQAFNCSSNSNRARSGHNSNTPAKLSVERQI